MCARAEFGDDSEVKSAPPAAKPEASTAATPQADAADAESQPEAPEVQSVPNESGPAPAEAQSTSNETEPADAKVDAKADAKVDAKADAKVDAKVDGAAGDAAPRTFTPHPPTTPHPSTVQEASDLDLLQKAASTRLQEESRKKMRALKRRRKREGAMTVAESQRVVDVEKADTFWKRQRAMLAHITARLAAAKTTFEQLRAQYKLSQTVAATTAKLMSSLRDGAVGEGESTTVLNACAAQRSLQKRAAEQTGQQTYERVIKAAEEHAASLARALPEVRATTERILAGIDAQRAQCAAAWSEYASAWAQRHRGEPAKPHKDPALLYRAYERALLELQTLHRHYQKHVPKLISRYYREDASRIGKLQSLMLETLLEDINRHQMCINMARSAIQSVQHIDAKADIVEFCNGKGIPVESVMLGRSAHQRAGGSRPRAPTSSGDAKASTAGDLLVAEISLPPESVPPVADMRVLEKLNRLETRKQGPLELRKRLLGIGSWSKLWAMLSYDGVLHLFGRYGDAQPYASLPLSMWSGSLHPTVDSLALRLYIENPGWSYSFSTTEYVLRASSFQDLTAWTRALKRYLKSGEIAVPISEHKSIEKAAGELKNGSGRTPPSKPDPQPQPPAARRAPESKEMRAAGAKEDSTDLTQAQRSVEAKDKIAEPESDPAGEASRPAVGGAAESNGDVGVENGMGSA